MKRMAVAQAKIGFPEYEILSLFSNSGVLLVKQPPRLQERQLLLLLRRSMCTNIEP